MSTMNYTIDGENLEETWWRKNENCHFRQRKKKNESNLYKWGWERLSTKPIAFNVGVLFNDGKKIVCLWNGLKIFHT